MNASITTPQDTKRVFFKKGACSHTFFYLLNREFGCPLETEERASDSLAGGIMAQGYQCGMLWGSALAAGAESFRRSDNRDRAIGMAITATQHLVESFSHRAKSVDCYGITGCDWTSKLGVAKYFLTGKFISCFKLAEKWAPEAIQSANEGFSLEDIREKTDISQPPISCASEVAKKMGASDEEMVMVAGFAGGLGLSGNACGALSAAIWMNSLAWCKNQTGKSSFNNPKATDTLKAFYAATGNEILCRKISGRCFETIDDHSEFIKNGGCEKLINVLAQS